MNAQSSLDRAVELQRAGRLEEARRLYRRLLDEDPDNASALHLLGLSFSDTPDWQQGAALIERAIELRPRESLFHFNLGVIYRQRGEFQQAQACYRRAVELRPGYGEAWGALVEITRYREGGDDLRRILEQLARGGEDEARRHFHFAAGKIFDDLGDYEQAFAHFCRGNALRKNGFDAERYLASCKAVCRVFNSGFFERRASWGATGVAPIFIIGMPRSGSSLAEQILASHPAVTGVGEVDDIRAIVAAMGERLRAPQAYPDFVPYLPADAFKGFAGSYLARMQSLAGDLSQRTVDKNLANFIYAGVVRLMFPDARVVHSRRHPLDTALSCFFQNFATGQAFSNRLEDIVSYFRGYRQVMRHWQEVLPGGVHHLDYERLVANPEPESRALLAFCGLDWDSGCLDFSATPRQVGTASSWQVRQPLYGRSVARWRNYEQHLGPLAQLLEEQA